MWLKDEHFLNPEVYKFKSEQTACVDPEVGGGGGGGGGASGPPLKNHKNIGFLSNSSPDPLKNYEATEPTFNVVPSSAHQRNAI